MCVGPNMFMAYDIVCMSKASMLHVIQTDNDWGIQTGHAYEHNIVQGLLKKRIKQIACKCCHKISN